MRGAGRVIFAAVLLTIAGMLNIIYGIGALDEANVFVGDSRLVFDDLNTYGWVLLILGLFQLTGGFSLASGHLYGRLIGITAGSFGALFALASVNAGNPWWSLGIFFLCIYVVYGIFVFGDDVDDRRAAQGPPADRV